MCILTFTAVIWLLIDFDLQHESIVRVYLQMHIAIGNKDRMRRICQVDCQEKR